MGKPRIINNLPKFVTKNGLIMDSALGRMGRDVEQLAKIRVPFKEGELQEEIRHEKRAPLNHRILVNKEYASYQEFAERKDGSHRVRRYTTPGTGKFYLTNAGLSVKKNAVNYFRQAVALGKLV